MKARQVGDAVLDAPREVLRDDGFEGSRGKAWLCWTSIAFFFVGCMYFAGSMFVMLNQWWDTDAGDPAHPLPLQGSLANVAITVLGLWAISAVCFFLSRDRGAPRATLGMPPISLSRDQAKEVMDEIAERDAAYKRGEATA